MRITVTWLRLEWRRRWRSLTVLALLVALASATVLTAAAGARRGQTAFDRLWASTLPATITVLPNQAGFDWAKVRALPEVAALAEFPVDGFGFGLSCCPQASSNFPPIGDAMTQTLERPVMLAGRVFDPRRADEIIVTPQFAASYHKGVGDVITMRLASPEQANNGYDGTTGPPQGPSLKVTIVGVGRSVWLSSTVDGPGSSGGVMASPALFERYRANIIGTNGQTYINAIIRLKHGAADIPAFRVGLARVSGRSDIDIWNNRDYFGGPFERIDRYEAACLLAFALAALVAAIFLIGQAVARFTSATVADLQVLQAVGMTPRQAVAAATAPPLLAAAAGSTLGVAAAIVASNWMPIGAASYNEPHPGIDADWLILGPGWVLVPVLVAAGAAAAAALGLSRRRQAVARRSAVAVAAASAGFGVPVVVGARFALEPGRGRSAVPVRPALLGAVVGVLGVLAAFTFAAGVSDAAANPARFGQTWQLDAFLGLSGQDLGPAAGQVLRAAAADPDVIGVDDARINGAQSGQVSVESFTYDEVGGKRVPVVLTDGRMPAAADEIVLAPTTAGELHAVTGSVVHLAGASGPLPLTVTGIGFVPSGPHNDYSDGAWLTPAGYDRLFKGAHFAFKFHAATVALRPGADVQAVAQRLDAKARKITGGQAFTFTTPDPLTMVQGVKDVAVLPLALSAFLAVLAIGAVGHALATAVRRRGHELAVLRALGLTRPQSRLIIVTQGTLLAVIGLAFGIPLGIALGRILWRAAADVTPLAYRPPVAILALLLIAPAVLLAANLLAAWPARRAARLRVAQILRTE